MTVFKKKRFEILFIAANLVTLQETEIRTLQRKLARRDNEIIRQQRELHKLRVKDEL